MSKKTKIVITGGLGYIGTELCKLYSGESRFKEIVVIDSKFVSERVKQLRDWGINFIQGSILDENPMSNVLCDADYVFHLAGVTDVAYTKFETNEEKDRQIRAYGIDGTNIVINSIPKKCKLIFPSTHVVFEGLTDVKFNVDENEPLCPVLSYSQTKAQSEYDIKNSVDNYIIVRLGSVYGYSTDTMRINIMPNLFSKMASQNSTISLFGGGVQYKSLINVIDVVRGLKFLAESDIKNEVFHLSNENMTVKEVAELCKKHKPEVNIIETKDEIPNVGYTLSNEKLLSTGFRFLYNVDDSIREMILNWSEKTQPDELEYIQTGTKEYIDSRGKISNYELTEPINLIGYIESVAGSVRANHYHPIQEQKCLLITGKYVSVTKDLADPNSTIETRLIKAGDIAVIRPNVAHTMVFLEDSIFLNLVRGEREHDNYGITHTIPYVLVDEEFRKQLINTYKTECRSCGNIHLKDVVSLGMSPLANNLIDNIDQFVEKFPLEMKYCPNCHNSQLSIVVPPEKMFDNYLYVSSTAASFRKHFEEAANNYIDIFNLDSGSLVVDIGSNDGIFLKPIIENGIKGIGVEPAKNLADIANNRGIKTYCSYFNDSVVDKIIEENGKADLITASNVFAHSDELVNITKQAFRLLNEKGQFIIEVQYLLDTFSDLTFDNIYHEHVNYWSVTSLNNFFNNLGLYIDNVEHINTHGGSIRVYVSRFNTNSETLEYYLEMEKAYGIKKYDKYKEFANNVHNIKENVVNNFKKLKSRYKKISAYGSPAKATTSLNFFGIDSSYIDYTIEDNELKNGKIIPGVNIPIRNKEYCLNNLPNVIVVLAWNFIDDIKRNNQNLIDMGVIFVSIKDLQSKDFRIVEENQKN